MINSFVAGGRPGTLSLPDSGVTVIRTLDMLDEMEGRWRGAHSPMGEFIWVRHGAAIFCRAGELRLLALESGGALVAAGQFRCRRGILSRFEHLGVEDLYEPTDLLYEDQPAMQSLAEALIRIERPLVFKRLPADSAAVEALRAACRRRALIDIRPASPSPYLELDRVWQDPEAMFNSGRRSDFRRAKKRALALGEVVCQLLSPGPSEVEPLLAEALEVESAGWKGRAGTAIVLDARRREFYWRYALDASRRGILRLAFLRIDGCAAAFQFAVEHDGRYYLLKIGYDEHYAACSPGTLLMLHVLGEAAQRGLHSIEFLGLPESWTRMWCDRLRPCVALRVYPQTLRGTLALATDAVKISWRSLCRSKEEE